MKPAKKNKIKKIQQLIVEANKINEEIINELSKLPNGTSDCNCVDFRGETWSTIEDEVDERIGCFCMDCGGRFLE